MMDLDDSIAFYLGHGYVILPQFLDADETAALREVTDRVAAGAFGVEGANPVFDFEPGHTAAEPLIQRIKKPNRVDPLYDAMARHQRLLAVIGQVIGANIRLNHTKINMKTARAGSPLEWHQDWAFAPHTNMATIVASMMIDECTPENGPVLVVPDSHKLGLLEHHDAEGFVGAISSDTAGLDLNSAVPLLGPAGTVALHHPLTVHGSAANLSGGARRILFLEYAASDAFPLFYPVEWGEYNARIVAGPETSKARLEPVEVKLPFPAPGSSIYKTQARLESRFFSPVSAVPASAKMAG